jgi:hypothetical protein
LHKTIASGSLLDKRVAFLQKKLIRNGHLKKRYKNNLWNDSELGKEIVWGWKDPRNTLTFPIWNKVFPNARYVYLARNGIDVAISLHTRALKSRQWWKRFFPRYYFSKRMLDFYQCIQLWEEYVEFFDNFKYLIRTPALHEIKYEDLLQNPVVSIQNLLEFIEMKVPIKKVESICEQVNSDKLNNLVLPSYYRDLIEKLPKKKLHKLNYVSPSKPF